MALFLPRTYLTECVLIRTAGSLLSTDETLEVKLPLTPKQNVDETTRQAHIIHRQCLAEIRRYHLVRVSCYTTSYARDEEMQFGMRVGKLLETVDIWREIFLTLNPKIGGNGVSLALQPFGLSSHGAEAQCGQGSATSMVPKILLPNTKISFGCKLSIKSGV